MSVVTMALIKKKTIDKKAADLMFTLGTHAAIEYRWKKR